MAVKLKGLGSGARLGLEVESVRFLGVRAHVFLACELGVLGLRAYRRAKGGSVAEVHPVDLDLRFRVYVVIYRP